MTFHDSPTDIPDPEVAPKAKRRKFSAEYKRRILEETDNLTEPGQTGALLRREELYSSRSPQVRPMPNWVLLSSGHPISASTSSCC